VMAAIDVLATSDMAIDVLATSDRETAVAT
jgi:hypothetical protein